MTDDSPRLFALVFIAISFRRTVEWPPCSYGCRMPLIRDALLCVQYARAALLAPPTAEASAGGSLVPSTAPEPAPSTPSVSAISMLDTAALTVAQPDVSSTNAPEGTPTITTVPMPTAPTASQPLLLDGSSNDQSPITEDGQSAVSSGPLRAPSPPAPTPREETEAAQRVRTPPPSATGAGLIDASASALASSALDTEVLGQEEELSVVLSGSPLTTGTTTASLLASAGLYTQISEQLLEVTTQDASATWFSSSVGRNNNERTRNEAALIQHDVVIIPAPATEGRQLFSNALGLSASAPASPAHASAGLRRTRSFDAILADDQTIVLSRRGSRVNITIDAAPEALAMSIDTQISSSEGHVSLNMINLLSRQVRR